MGNDSYELKMAYHRMVEHQQQAEHARLVKELKKFKREQDIGHWRRSIGYSLIKLGKRLTGTSIKATYGRQTPLAPPKTNEH